MFLNVIDNTCTVLYMYSISDTGMVFTRGGGGWVGMRSERDKCTVLCGDFKVVTLNLSL